MIEAELVGGPWDGQPVNVAEGILMPDLLKFDASGTVLPGWQDYPFATYAYRRSAPVRKTKLGRVAYDWETPYMRKQAA